MQHVPLVVWFMGYRPYMTRNNMLWWVERWGLGVSYRGGKSLTRYGRERWTRWAVLGTRWAVLGTLHRGVR